MRRPSGGMGWIVALSALAGRDSWPRRPLPLNLPPLSWRRGLQLGLIGLVLLSLTTTSLELTRQQLYEQRLIEGVRVRQIDLGGMSLPQARQVLAQAFKTYENSALVFATGKQRWRATPAELGIRLDVDATLQAAFAVGHDGSPLSRLSSQWAIRSRGQTVEPIVRVDDEAMHAGLDSLARAVNLPAISAELRLEGEHLITVPEVMGQRLDQNAVIREVTARARTLSSEPIRLTTIAVRPDLTSADLAPVAERARRMLSAPVTLTYEDREWTLLPADLASLLDLHVERYLSGGSAVRPVLAPDKVLEWGRALALELNRLPVEGRFEWRDGQVAMLQAPVDGVSVPLDDLPGLLTRLAQAGTPAERRVAVPAQATKASLPVEALADGHGPIRQPLASASLAYSYSNPSRAHNIELGAQAIHGVVVPPGAVFSFNQIVGDTTPDKGYGLGWAIVDGHYQIDYGGGICQVATTLFQAVYFGGYELEERTNHAIRITAYEPRPELAGVDATVYYPYVDFKFRNNGDTPLLIDARAGGGRITVTLYGTDQSWHVEAQPPVVGAGGQVIESTRIVTDALGLQRVLQLKSEFVGIE